MYIGVNVPSLGLPGQTVRTDDCTGRQPQLPSRSVSCLQKTFQKLIVERQISRRTERLRSSFRCRAVKGLTETLCRVKRRCLNETVTSGLPGRLWQYGHLAAKGGLL